TEVVEGPGFARLNRDAGLGVGGAVMRFVAQQAGFGVAGTQGAGFLLALGLPGGLVAELMGRGGARHGRRGARHGRRLPRHVQAGGGWWAGLLFAEAVERGVGFDGGRVHGLRVARHQPGGHALGKDVVEQVLEDGRGIQLAGATNRRVPGQLGAARQSSRNSSSLRSQLPAASLTPRSRLARRWAAESGAARIPSSAGGPGPTLPHLAENERPAAPGRTSRRVSRGSGALPGRSPRRGARCRGAKRRDAAGKVCGVRPAAARS
nr:hypothetical protein [Tanacetum cinerariifolium]